MAKVGMARVVMARAVMAKVVLAKVVMAKAVMARVALAVVALAVATPAVTAITGVTGVTIGQATTDVPAGISSRCGRYAAGERDTSTGGSKTRKSCNVSMRNRIVQGLYPSG